jgi:hypothetical protein
VKVADWPRSETGDTFMKANQLLAGTVIVAGLIFSASALAQGLGGLGGHIGGALGGGAGGGMAGVNGTGGMNGAMNGNTLGANADGFGRATRIHNQDVSAATATDTKSHSASSTVNGSGKAGNTGSKPKVPSADSTAGGTAQTASKPAAAQSGAQLAGSANASKGGVDADASGQGTANHPGFSASTSARSSTQVSAGH